MLTCSRSFCFLDVINILVEGFGFSKARMKARGIGVVVSHLFIAKLPHAQRLRPRRKKGEDRSTKPQQHAHNDLLTMLRAAASTLAKRSFQRTHVGYVNNVFVIMRKEVGDFDHGGCSQWSARRFQFVPVNFLRESTQARPSVNQLCR